MSKPLVRTEKHRLAAHAATVADAERTIVFYRRIVRLFAGLMLVHYPELVQAESRCFAFERLFHVTAQNPNPRYRMLDAVVGKMPSYLRRAAIEAAYGAVSSYLSNYARWQTGQRSRRDARPPSFARALEVNPPLYGGNMLLADYEARTVQVKLLGRDGQWRFTEPLRLHGRLRRLTTETALSPTLLVRRAKMVLACPVEVHRPAWSGGDVVCSVDLNVGCAAVAAIVDSVGTVRARRFISCGRHNDQLDKLATAIRQRANRTLGPLRPVPGEKKRKRPGVLSKGFCAKLYRRIGHLNRDAAQRIANELVAFAAEHGATTVVFEHLKGWRPRAPRVSLRHRFHRWLHRLVVRRTRYKLEEQGLKLAFVAPAGTSKWAHDGSGEVTRSKRKYALASWRLPDGRVKHYNADLNAALNIAARFIARCLGVTASNRPAAAAGKSSGAASRMPIVLADIWAAAGAPVAAFDQTY